MEPYGDVVCLTREAENATVGLVMSRTEHRGTLQAARRLDELSRDETLHPEQRIFLRAVLAGDPDALAALRRRDGVLVADLLRALRQPNREKRAVLHLVV